MKLFRNAVVISLAVLISACANPLKWATSDRYSRTCAEPERAWALTVAEEACYRALVNVDLGNLGDHMKCQKMYNLAGIKSRLGKFDEAEELYKESIAIEEKLTPISDERVGRRAAKLAGDYVYRLRLEEGLPYVERLSPSADDCHKDIDMVNYERYIAASVAAQRRGNRMQAREQASTYFKAALVELDKVNAKVKTPYEYADILDEYALAKRKLGDKTNAAPLAWKAKSLRAREPEPHDVTDRTPYGQHCEK